MAAHLLTHPSLAQLPVSPQEASQVSILPPHDADTVLTLHPKTQQHQKGYEYIPDEACSASKICCSAEMQELAFDVPKS